MWSEFLDKYLLLLLVDLLTRTKQKEVCKYMHEFFYEHHRQKICA